MSGTLDRMQFCFHKAISSSRYIYSGVNRYYYYQDIALSISIVHVTEVRSATLGGSPGLGWIISNYTINKYDKYIFAIDLNERKGTKWNKRKMILNDVEY